MTNFTSVIKMLGPFRQSSKHLNHAALALTNTTIGEVINGIATTRNYSDKKDGAGCCKDIAQTAGMKVDPWTKSDQAPVQWRPECQLGPQPINYDPYRIKVSDTVVPPLPPSNVKRIHVLNTSTDQQNQERQAYQTNADQSSAGCQHGYHHHQQVYEEQESKDPGILGRIKGFFGRLKGKGKDRGDAMMTGHRNINWLYR